MRSVLGRGSLAWSATLGGAGPLVGTSGSWPGSRSGTGRARTCLTPAAGGAFGALHADSPRSSAQATQELVVTCGDLDI